MFLDPSKERERRRHKLPHWQQEKACICATWRTADSLPRTVLGHWNEQRAIWLSLHPQPWDEATDLEYYERFASEMDEHLDRGYGACPLRESGNARIVADALRHFDGDRYELSDFVVMPNHVHVLFAPGSDQKLADIIQSWKRHNARMINLRMGVAARFLGSPDTQPKAFRLGEGVYRSKSKGTPRRRVSSVERGFVSRRLPHSQDSQVPAQSLPSDWRARRRLPNPRSLSPLTPLSRSTA
jgi:hypothetical protein